MSTTPTEDRNLLKCILENKVEDTDAHEVISVHRKGFGRDRKGFGRALDISFQRTIREFYFLDTQDDNLADLARRS